jgi:hypothetical protein
MSQRPPSRTWSTLASKHAFVFIGVLLSTLLVFDQLLDGTLTTRA